MAKQNILDDFDFDEHDFFPEEGDSEVIGKYYSPMEAELAAARLRAEGIPCFLANSNSQSILPSSLVYVRLHVRPDDKDRAKSILLTELPPTDETRNLGSIWENLLVLAAVLLGIMGILYLIKIIFN
ncbi:MAG: DUF2007 domain-containing protein [Bacteroidetes bacterium]|nr:DUF2007 domain-containing protein [Bacteroidota bacterium]